MAVTRSKTTFLDILVRIIAIILGLALTLGNLAGNLDPRDYKYIPFFGLAYPYLLLINALFLGWWCIRKRWSIAFGTMVVILLGWNSLNATFGIFGEEGEGAKINSEDLRMMTYNVHTFTPYGEKNIVPAKQQMLELIRTENPDVICFQEYFTRRKGEFDITDSLKRILKTSHYYFVPFSENDYEASGLAIFSRYPIINKGAIKFGENTGGNSSIFIDIEVNKKKMRIYNVHLQSISFGEQDYSYIDKITQKIDPDIVPTKRIASMLRTAFVKRSEQVDIMKAHMRTCTTPFLIAGDFNDTPASYAVTQLTRSLNNTFKEQGTGLGRTYNGKFPNFQIDYIATTTNIEVLNYRVIPAKLSDHFPVRSDLRLNP